MARPRKDITGKRYGMLRAISPTGEVDKSGNAYWNCECDCGNTIVVSLRNLRNKQTKSCGCLKTINGKKLGAITRNHCVDGSDPYKLYGDKPRKNNKSGYRGVSLNKRTNRYAADITFKGKRHHLGEFDTAEEAHDAYLKAKEELHEPYLKDFLHSNPEEKSKVERIGVIKKPRGTLVYYTPENRYISIPELSEITGVSRVNLYSRLNKGYTGEELWSAKRLPNKRPAKIYIDYHGKKVTFAELSTLTGISISTLGIRYHRGYQGEVLWSTKRLTGKGKCTICVDYYGDQVTIPELSSITGISDATLRYRYDKGYRGEELWTGKIQHYQRKKAISQKAKIYVEYDGEKVSLYELSKKIGIDYGFLWKRYSKGVRGSQLFQESMKKEILVDYEGEKINLKELSSRTGIGYTTLHRRYRSGDCGKELWRNLQSEKEIDYQGKIVTLNELSKITNISYDTLLHRYSSGDRGEDLWRPIYKRRKKK
ncbi:AP2 domain-containing protein [[Clostridium] innocuum]|nr:AP2 domain-containing protein [[Clostridium] innocuum]